MNCHFRKNCLPDNTLAMSRLAASLMRTEAERFPTTRHKIAAILGVQFEASPDQPAHQDEEQKFPVDGPVDVTFCNYKS